jgi:ribonuclease D
MAAFLQRVDDAGWLAMDTEADSLHAYPEKLCLIQISIPGENRLIDPLAQIDIAPLWPAIRPHELIMHGADYDLRLLRKNCDFVPERVFDTMLAARLVGDREFGLMNLAKNYLGVTLEKGSQKADWSKRPLTEKMEVYARNDTRHLKAISDRLRQKLVETGRLEWHRESCDRLIDECSHASKPEPDQVWRIKGAHRLDQTGLGILRELWRWRETEATTVNKPPYFVMAHEAMIEIALAAAAGQPVDPIIPRHFSPRRRDLVAAAIAKARQLPPEDFPRPKRHVSHRQTEAERRRFEEIEKKRNARATELSLDPTLIASRADMLQLAQDWDRFAPEMMRWQRQLLES